MLLETATSFIEVDKSVLQIHQEQRNSLASKKGLKSHQLTLSSTGNGYGRKGEQVSAPSPDLFQHPRGELC
jgi:hypothetical protein